MGGFNGNVKMSQHRQISTVLRGKKMPPYYLLYIAVCGYYLASMMEKYLNMTSLTVMLHASFAARADAAQVLPASALAPVVGSFLC